MTTMRMLFLGPAAIIGIFLFALLGGVIVMWLWNWLTPSLFGWPTITFWQGFALLALARLLFGGLGMHNGGGRHAGSKFRARLADRVADRVADRIEKMTPEEKERFRQRLRERGFDTGGGA